MSTQMKRTARKAGSLLAATLLAAWAGGAQADQATLYIGMNGGDMERAFTQYVFPPFEKEHGVKVVVVPGTSADVLAKAQAYKDNPQMHVMFLDDGVMYRAISMGLCEKLEPSEALSQLYPTARMKDDMAAAVDMGLTGVAYNTKMFADQGWAPPTSWADFADPKYKGKVVMQSMPSSSYGLHAFLMFNRIQGGTEQDVNPGFERWNDAIGGNVLEYISNSSKISEMVQTGEAGIFPLTFTAVARLADRGQPFGFVAPKEGPVLLSVGECVIAGNNQPKLAQALASYLLSAPAQELALQHSGNVPSNPNAKGGDAAQQKYLADFKTAVAHAVVLDWDQINQHRPEWNTRWNRTVEQ
ncbi:ABC transporter substrate-binding protein [Castellaniella hirudinis]|uniref:ABC transporter substrate-binding protein n=1 Tax=Castellaniella hirudinis TaxID=1144617 RepID=UPI0039C24AE2